MSEENTENHINEEKVVSSKIEENLCLKSVRVTINLMIHVLISLVVFVCLWFACSSGITFFNLHIILCVLGYQFFMCHATLVISQYNASTMFIARRYKKHLHWVLQVFAVAMVTTGTVFVILQKDTHFTSIHGILGLAALVLAFVSLLNGVLVMFSHKASSSAIGKFWIKFFHYISGIATIFLGTGSLCAAFNYNSFRTWTGEGDAFIIALMALTCLFTVLITLDFWIATAIKFRTRSK
ncbi:hypothetical protein SFRURICE_001464 [Spodoptera frugiperda]|uniref:ascorbate ferrireductase (transmembrane) n=1 Tax=Spodoptera frugiperda TaxID=7108 RepID=A0A2H1VLM6_SPOFR|nr:hypothetical protein SFRURICE_001464 [Spodoptera frugiperda]